MRGMQKGRHERWSWIDVLHWRILRRTRWVRAKTFYIQIIP